MSALDQFTHSPHLDLGVLRFVTAGSVDDGKSTLIGRLLFDSKSLFEDQVAAVAKASERRGRAGVDLALLTDGLEAEREQGITIDVAYRYFATPRRKFIIGDSPGHEQYTRNMVTAASTADAAIVLVDARQGVVRQTRRHAAIAAMLRVPTLIFAVNKMDLVAWSESRFREIERDIQTLYQQLSDRFSSANRTLRVIPVSALLGVNLVERSPVPDDEMSWYVGEALLPLLESLPVSQSLDSSDLRFPVQGVARPADQASDATLHDFRAYTGRIEAGKVCVGDEVTVLPSGKHSQVSRITVLDQDLTHAVNGQSVMIHLKDDIDVSRGDLIASGQLPECVQDFRADIVSFSSNLLPRKRYWLKHGTRWVKAMVTEIEQRMDVESLATLPGTDSLVMNDIARVHLKLQASLPLDAFATHAIGGSFILVDEATHETAAAGMVV